MPDDKVTSTAVDELLALHKKQQKDLVATITGLKKQATKKTRKNVNVKCQELQESLNRKQEEELAALQISSDDIPRQNEISPDALLEQLTLHDEAGGAPSVADAHEAEAPRRRNRQKERLAKRNAQIEQMKQEALAESKDAVDYRSIEMQTMETLLNLNGLVLHEIRPDGNCLFNSIKDQLEIRHGVSKTVEQLRQLAADYILEHPDDFVPYLIDKDELIEVEQYCDKLANTVMWGSDVELLAFSQVFQCPIEILLAGSDKVQFNESGPKAKLVLGFYKHSFGLGEHYNSLRDRT